MTREVVIRSDSVNRYAQLMRVSIAGAVAAVRLKDTDQLKVFLNILKDNMELFEEAVKELMPNE